MNGARNAAAWAGPAGQLVEDQGIVVGARGDAERRPIDPVCLLVWLAALGFSAGVWALIAKMALLGLGTR